MPAPGNEVLRTRRHPRYEIDAYADVTGREVLLYHRIRNVSLGGMCLESPPVGEVGSTVEVTLNFPQLRAEVSLEGQVAWVNSGSPVDMGICWIGLGDEERELLGRYLRRATRRRLSTADPEEQSC